MRGHDDRRKYVISGIDDVSASRRVLIWTENESIGGCDRFAVDLYHAMQGTGLNPQLAGNNNPRMNAFLVAQGVKEPRLSIPIWRAQTLGLLVEWLSSAISKLGYGERSQPASRTEGQSRKSDADNSQSRTFLGNVKSCFGVLARLACATSNYWRQVRLLKVVRPDTVVINNGGYPAGESCLTMALAARAANVRNTIFVVHNIPRRRGWPVRFERWVDGLVSTRVSSWVTASDYTSGLLIDRRGVPRERVHTIRHGLPARRLNESAVRRTVRRDLALKSSEFDILVTMVALFEKRKGHEFAVQALGQVAGEHRYHLLLVGDGPTRKDIEQMVRDQGLEQYVTFAGWTDDIDDVLSATDILILPSVDDECLPYAILHAMQHSLPVVSSRLAGIPEQVLDGVTGFLTDPGDVSGIAAALLDLGDEGTRKAMGERGFERLSEEFDPRVGVSRFISLC